VDDFESFEFFAAALQFLTIYSLIVGVQVSSGATKGKKYF
jgi:hypothetical protein